MNTQQIDIQAASYLSLWQITAGQRLRYTTAICAMVLTNICLFGAPIIGGGAIDVITHQDFAYADTVLLELSLLFTDQPTMSGYLWTAALASLLITAMGGIFLYLRGRFAAEASENIARRLRQTLYERLHHVRAKFYDTADTGDLVQRCSSDVETLRVFLVSDVIEIGRAIMLLVCLVPILFHIHAPLAWWSLCLMPFLILGAFIFFRSVKQAFQVADEAEGAMTATLQENLTGIRVVRAFARQTFEEEKFGRANEDFRAKTNRLIELMGYYWSVSDFFSMSQIGIVLFMGAYFVTQGSLSVGDLFIFMTCESIVIWPVRQLGRVLTDTGKAVISLGRVEHILDSPAEAEQLRPATGRSTGAITARDLTVGYDDEKPVLSNLSIDIQPGETLAIVGPPGSGKSTFIRALLNLYPKRSGQLLLDGRDVAELDRLWLRSQIGVVMQDPFLYSRTIEGNLTVGRSNATRELLDAACREAAILGAIESFPDGYDAMVGERGVTLSGGQRQRLALARAFLKDAPVLVLDDALSAVDTQTEQHILQAIEARRGRQTTIIIAHRLSSVVGADRIMVLDEGAVVQLGTHEELLNQPGPYRVLCEIQGALDASIRRDLKSAQHKEP